MSLTMQNCYDELVSYIPKIEKLAVILCWNDKQACIVDEKEDALVDALFALHESDNPDRLRVVENAVKAGSARRKRARRSYIKIRHTRRKEDVFRGVFEYDRAIELHKATSCDVENWMDLTHNQQRAWTAIKLMDPWTRAVIYQHLFNDKTLVDIANELGIRSDSVSKQLRRGLSRVREIMRYLP